MNLLRCLAMLVFIVAGSHPLYAQTPSTVTAKAGQNKLVLVAPSKNLYPILLAKNLFGDAIDEIIKTNQEPGKKLSREVTLAESVVVASIDINGDETPEYVVRWSISDYCGSAGCETAVLQKQGNNYVKIFSGYLQDDEPSIFVDPAKKQYFLTGEGQKILLKLASSAQTASNKGDAVKESLGKIYASEAGNMTINQGIQKNKMTVCFAPKQAPGSGPYHFTVKGNEAHHLDKSPDYFCSLKLRFIDGEKIELTQEKCTTDIGLKKGETKVYTPSKQKFEECDEGDI